MVFFFFSRSILQHQTSHYIPNLCASHFILIHCAERQAVLKWQLSAARERLGSTENRSKSSHTSPTHISPPSCCPCSRNPSGTILRFGLAQHFHYRNGFSIAPLGLERACSVPDLLKKETELRNCEEKGCNLSLSRKCGPAAERRGAPQTLIMFWLRFITTWTNLCTFHQHFCSVLPSPTLAALFCTAPVAWLLHLYCSSCWQAFCSWPTWLQATSGTS